MSDKFISKAQAAEQCGLSCVTLWRLERDGKFPARRQISPNRVAYLESEVVAWMESRTTEYAEFPSTKAGTA